MKKYFLYISVYLICLSGFSQVNSTDKILKIAKNIEESIQNNYTIYINNLFDFQSFNESYLAINNDLIIQSYNFRFIEQIKQSLSPGDLISNEIGENGSYKFIDIKITNRDTVLVFQLLNEEGLSYHDLYLTNISGEYRITDIYNYSKYELLSESVSKIYYRSLYEIFPQKDKLNKLSEYKKSEKIEHKLAKLMTRGKFNQAYLKYNRIQDKYKDDKNLLLLAIKAASFTGENETAKVLTQYFYLTNDDKRILLLPIDGLFITGYYKQSLEYLDKLDNEVCHDPFLNYYRGKIQERAGNNQMAEQCFTKLNNSLPELQTGYFSLLELYIEKKDYQAAINMLDKIESRFGYYKHDLEDMLEEYTNFRKSNEFTQWINY